MTEELAVFDPADHLNSDQAIADFICAALETNDPGYVAHALGVVARARGMTEIARRTGLSREQLYRSFSVEGNPTLRTMLAVLQAVGIRLFARRGSGSSDHGERRVPAADRTVTKKLGENRQRVPETDRPG